MKNSKHIDGQSKWRKNMEHGVTSAVATSPFLAGKGRREAILLSTRCAGEVGNPLEAVQLPPLTQSQEERGESGRREGNQSQATIGPFSSPSFFPFLSPLLRPSRPTREDDKRTHVCAHGTARTQRSARGCGSARNVTHVHYTAMNTHRQKHTRAQGMTSRWPRRIVVWSNRKVQPFREKLPAAVWYRTIQ